MFRYSLILSLILCPFLSCIADDQTSQAKQLIEASNLASDLSLAGPYQLEAVLVLHQDGSQARGTLTSYQDASRSRSVLDFTNYHEADVLLGNRLYVVRNTPFPVPDLESLSRSRPVWQAFLPNDATVKSVFSSQIHGLQAQCFEVILERDGRRQDCFDSTRKIRIQEKITTPEVSWEMEFLDYQTVGDRLVPGTVRFLEHGRLLWELENIQIQRSQIDTALFAIPAQAIEVGSCAGMQPAKLVKHIEPDYPVIARMSQVTGRVHTYALIAKDGSLHNVRVISGNPVLVESALNAVRRWHYSPATCGGEAVASETQITIDFGIKSRPY